MAKYRVEACEKFYVTTTYVVEADSPEDAAECVESGQEPYESHTVDDDPGEFRHVRSIEELDEHGAVVGPTLRPHTVYEPEE